ncbi:MAG: hypothetical protein COB02_16040 [Candidatus Cloacimonadota bacterium]|nr:MAG: hypothetical protein COB02_16040 [Candidatus Cloacimonadota bacterium]
MKLQNNKLIKQNLWAEHSSSLLSHFSKEIKEQYSFIFAMNDYQTLLQLNNSQVQDLIEVFQTTYLEGLINLLLNDMFDPHQLTVNLKGLNEIHVDSLFTMGLVHRICENPSAEGFILTRFFKSKPQDFEDEKACIDIDEVVNTIGQIETLWKEKKSLKV